MSILIYWRKILVFGVVFIEQPSTDSFPVVFVESTPERKLTKHDTTSRISSWISYWVPEWTSNSTKVGCPGCRSLSPFISSIFSEHEQLHGKLEANRGWPPSGPGQGKRSALSVSTSSFVIIHYPSARVTSSNYHPNQQDMTSIRPSDSLMPLKYEA